MQGAVQATGLATLLLALSLAGAFHLVENVFAIKWRVKRQKEQALYLAYLYWAAVLAIAAALIISLLPNLLWLVDATRLYASEAITMPEIWTDHDWTPEFEYQPVGTGVVAFLLGHALPPIANRWLDEIESIGRAVDDSVFEKTLFEAQLDGTPVMYTLKNRQVYVGFTFGLPDPSKKNRGYRSCP